jgi:hypothetical protein
MPMFRTSDLEAPIVTLETPISAPKHLCSADNEPASFR